MSFQEPEYIGNIQRMTYLSDMEALIARRQADSAAERDRFMADYPRDIEEKRRRYLDMLGWPLNAPRPAGSAPRADYTPIGADGQTDIFRVAVEALPGFRFGGLLFRQRGGAARPLVISQHGGLGTPELVGGLYRGGDTGNYNDMTRRVLARGAHVFSPQLLLWDQEKYHIHYDRRLIDNQLKQLGGSIAALEIDAIMRAVDVLAAEPWVDAGRIGMVGLSYGGFYALFAAAADIRLKSCVAAGFFNDRIAYNWFDWTWKDAARTFLDAEVGALVAPRGLHLQLGTRDDLFAEQPARAEFERLARYYERAGCRDRLSIEFFDGTHEFSRSEETIDALMKDLA
ncbi:MAG: prolyl oligopeptidase family serine peptidase [Clostridia bacterium]|nr:prolyl oligopeptidase family serine peptidase [Clostridia bacterium]